MGGEKRKDSGLSAGSGLDLDGGVVDAATPKIRDFAVTKTETNDERVHTVPIKATKEPSSVWARMKVTAFSKIGCKG